MTSSKETFQAYLSGFLKLLADAQLLGLVLQSD